MLQATSYKPQASGLKPQVSSIYKLLLLFILLATSLSSVAQSTLTLPEAIRTGLENNLSIQIQATNMDIARNNNTLGNAGFLPTIGVTGTQNLNISTTHQEQFSGTVRDVTNAQNTAFNTGIQLNWTLFDGMNMFVNKKMLGVMEELGENGSRLVVEEIVSEIILTYYGVIQLKKLERVSRDAVALSMQRKKIAQAKLSLGSGSRLMLLQSTVDLNADSTRLITQISTMANLKARLNRLLVRDVTQPFDIADSIPLGLSFNFDTLLNNALSQNKALIAARLSQNLDELNVKGTQSDRYPKLDLNAAYSYSQSNSAAGFLKYNQSYGPSVGVTLSYNLFDGFNVNREIKNAKVLLNSGELSTKDAEQELRLNLLQLYNDYRSNLQIVQLQVSNVAVAQENVVIAFEKYKLGSINDIELREIQKKLIDAQYQLILSSFQAKQAEVGLHRLSGEVLEIAR
jgi:outer membrane protein